MAQTVGDLFPKTDHVRAWLSLDWGSRKETPEQVADRILRMLPLLRTRFRDDRDTRWRMMVPSGSGTGWTDVPGDPAVLGEMIRSPRQRDAPDSPVDTGTLRTDFSLVRGPEPGSELFTFSIEAGRSQVRQQPANGISLLPPAGFIIGVPEEACGWFAELVRIWQPEHACLITPETMDLSREKGKRLGVGHRPFRVPSVGYLNWFSSIGYGRLPFPLDAVTRESPAGTLIAVSEWNARAVADLYAELETMGMLRKMPEVQVLPPPGSHDRREPHAG